MRQNFIVMQGALDRVEVFLSVAEHRSFSRAAAELGVSSSAISQAVRALETRVGAALFIRTTRNVWLTEAGEHFLSRAKPRERRRQLDDYHVWRDELAQTDTGIKPVGHDVDQLPACGDLDFNLGIGLAEGCY